jgi:DNA-binding winged helix-turn-helix (wHTH) protein/TolB-like protein/Tfp pilus assembly protein PilF
MPRAYEFGAFRLDERERTLRREGVPVKLTPRSFDVLLALLARGGSLVEKSALLGTVWGEVHVDEAVLARAISDLRKALGQNGGQVWIETVPKFGYRFVGALREAPPDAARAGGTRLRWAWAAGIVLAAALMVLVIGRGSARPDMGVQSLVVLPFEVVGDETGGEALGVGLADALVTRLSNVEGLIVRPLSTVRRFGRTTDPLGVARALRADAALEGTLHIREGRARAGLRLIRAADGRALWADTIESRADRLFALEDSLAGEVAAKLAVRLTEVDRRGQDLHSELNPAAHRLYVNGRYEWSRRNRVGFERAAEYFRQAIDLDPRYARAYAGLADCYLLLGGYAHYPQLEMLPKAKATALRALELDPRLAEAHATLGLIAQNLDWDWTETERQYRDSIRLAPNYATAHHWYAEFLSIMGRFDDARREFARAREIDPISPIIQVDEAQLYFFERRYDRSLALLDKAARQDPSFALARERIAFTFLMQGRDEDAWREAMKLPDCASESSGCRRMWTAWLPRLDPAAAGAALAQLDADAQSSRAPAYAALFGHIRQGRTDRALDWLERMLRTHGVWLITAKVNPLFDPLRSEPRAQAVLAKLHLQ